MYLDNTVWEYHALLLMSSAIPTTVATKIEDSRKYLFKIVGWMEC